MKKKLLVTFLTVLLLVCTLGLFACDEGGLKGVEIELPYFELIDENVFFTEVDNETNTFDFNVEVKIASGAKFYLAKDENGEETILTKKTKLKEGDNIFYILVENPTDVFGMYKVNVYRTPHFTVTFDTLGGSTIQSQSILSGNNASVPITPIREGFTFAGWDFNFSKKITANTVIKVKDWIPNKYKISFDSNGGDSVNSVTRNFSKPYSDLPIPENLGYEFLGWYTQEDGGEKITNESIVNTPNNHKLYARWFVDLKYQLNGDTYEVIGVNNTEKKNLVILNEYEGLPVTSIRGEKEEGYGKIQRGAFYNGIPGTATFKDSTFETLTISSSITDIGEKAFQGCTAQILWEENPAIRTIGESAFEKYYGSAPLNIPEGVTKIGNYAFMGCEKLEIITLPNTLIDLGLSAFSSCDSLIYNVNNYICYLGNTTNPYLVLVQEDNDTLPTYQVAQNCKIIHSHAFSTNTTLQNITLPNGLLRISEYAFNGCSSLQNFVIPNSVTWMGGDVFGNCVSLKSITIGNGLNSLGRYNDENELVCNYIFNECVKLTRVNFTGSIEQWASINWLGDKNNPLYFGKRLYINGIEQTNISINNVNKINDYAFINCTSLTKLEIGNNVNIIGNYAFSGCTNLTEATVNGKIGVRAFENNSSLTDLIMGNNCTYLEEYCFSGCESIVDIVIGDSVTYVGKGAFSGNEAETIVIGKSVEYILDSFTLGSSFVTNNTLTEISFKSPTEWYYIKDTYDKNTSDMLSKINGTFIDVTSSSFTSFFNANFNNPVMKYYRVNHSLVHHDKVEPTCLNDGHEYYVTCNDCNYSYGYTVIPKLVHEENEECTICGKYNLVYELDSSGKYYRVYGKSYTSTLSKYEIRDTINGLPVKTILGNSFKDCTILEEIVIPSSITNIGSSAFSGCTSLTKVNYLGTINQWAMIDFYNKASNPLYYTKHLYINDVKVTEVNLTTATKVGDYAFYNAKSITKVTLGNSVTSIGSSTFSDCTSLTSVTIPNSVKDIGDSAFYGCDELTSITIPSSVKYVGNNAFFGCYALTRVDYTGTIDQWAMIKFYCNDNRGYRNYCSNPLSYSHYLYINGAEIREVNLTTAIGVNEGAFYNATSITKVTLGNSVEMIYYYAFYNCSSLTSITIPNSVTWIWNNAFSGCTSLSTIKFNGTIAEWNAIEKWHDWNYNVPITQVICTDGTVDI